MSARKSKSPRRLGQLLKGDASLLSALNSHAGELQRATEALQAVLPANLRGHWQVAGLDEKALVVSTQSAGWATGLRPRQAQLLDEAEKILGTRPATLAIRIQTPAYAPPASERKQLSARSAAQLNAAAEGMIDPRLAAALRRIARHHRED